MADQAALRMLQEDRAPASWNRFYVVLTGRTNGAHQSVVKTFKSLGQTEVTSPEEADYCLVFCPVVSRVGTDVSEALDHLLPDKGAVLVVMHHTFNKEQVIPPSRRLVEDQRVKLTLDCLFHQNKLLHCQFNNNMNYDIMKFFGVSNSNVRWIVWFFQVVITSLLCLVVVLLIVWFFQLLFFQKLSTSLLCLVLVLLIVWFSLVLFFQKLLTFPLYPLDLSLPVLQFVLDKTGLTHLLERHLDPSYFRRNIFIFIVLVLTIYLLSGNDTNRTVDDRPDGQNQA